jgi:hypothetical protein
VCEHTYFQGIINKIYILFIEVKDAAIFALKLKQKFRCHQIKISYIYLDVAAHIAWYAELDNQSESNEFALLNFWW